MGDDTDTPREPEIRVTQPEAKKCPGVPAAARSWTSRGRKYRVWRQGAEAEPHPAPGAQTADQEKEAQRGTEAT